MKTTTETTTETKQTEVKTGNPHASYTIDFTSKSKDLVWEFIYANPADIAKQLKGKQNQLIQIF